MPLIPLIQGSRFALLQPGVPFSPSLEILRYAFINANPLQIDQSIGQSTDPSAQAFFIAQTNAGQTLTSIQKTAINARVVAAKTGTNYWSKLFRYWPFLGNSATCNSIDLVAQAVGTFNGTVTHNSNGITGDGATGYFDSGFNLHTNSVDLNSNAFGFYTRAGSNTNAVEVCAKDPDFWYIYLDGGTCVQTQNGGLGQLSFTLSNELGLFIASRTAFNAQAFYQNGSQIISGTGLTSALPIVTNVTELCYGNGEANFSNKTHCSMFVSSGLTSADVAQFYTDEQAFQTALGRQV